jgi:hypothetical protein
MKFINHVSSFANDCGMYLLFDITGIFYFLTVNLIVAARCELGTARCELRIARCESRTARCELGIARCKFGTARCKFGTAQCKPETVRCKLGTARCKLGTAQCEAKTASNTVISECLKAYLLKLQFILLRFLSVQRYLFFGNKKILSGLTQKGVQLRIDLPANNFS